jgi:hypothetical protein
MLVIVTADEAVISNNEKYDLTWALLIRHVGYHIDSAHQKHPCIAMMCVVDERMLLEGFSSSSYHVQNAVKASLYDVGPACVTVARKGVTYLDQVAEGFYLSQLLSLWSLGRHVNENHRYIFTLCCPSEKREDSYAKPNGTWS